MVKCFKDEIIEVKVGINGVSKTEAPETIIKISKSSESRHPIINALFLMLLLSFEISRL